MAVETEEVDGGGEGQAGVEGDVMYLQRVFWVDGFSVFVLGKRRRFV